MKFHSLPIQLPLLLVALTFCFPLGLGADPANSTFAARLAPMPVDFRSARTVTGLGQLRAQLAGSRLTVIGRFQDLSGPATTASLHRGPLAIPGPAVAELQITPAAAGEISGTVDLTPQQVEDLHNRALYVQIHSEAAPDGNLRGWLLAVPSE